MLKEIIIAFQSYSKAHHFVRTHRLWKWILIPGILYSILFIIGIYFFWGTANTVVSWLGSLGVDRFVRHQRSAVLNYFFLMGGLMVHLVLVFFYFSLFKYLMLIIGAPLFAYLSAKTDAVVNGRDYSFRFDRGYRQDMARGIRLAVRNALWQTVYLVCILFLAFVPLAGWIAPVVCVFVECYYYGFSMLDYSCARHQLSPQASVAYIGQRKGFAVGNGIIFYLLHCVPVIAPAYAIIAATISLYNLPATQPAS
ncbi:MAG TPA: EI24 domain-containing protein [Puia sp.]|nr:EI24 domain-containing protein [Puia sp.]